MDSAAIQNQAEKPNVELAANSSQYLTFILNGEEYGIQILKVQGIQGVGKVTPLPNTPEFVLGVINLRGEIVPIIDLRARFGMETIPAGPETVVIIVRVASEESERTVGLLVDAVSEVHHITADNLAPPPDFGTDINASYIHALAMIEEHMLILLDIDHLINSGVMTLVDALTQASSSVN